MRSFILSLVLGMATLGVVAATPSGAEARPWNRGYYYNEAPAYYYNTTPAYNYSSYYYAPGTVTEAATPAYSYPVYSGSYYAPSYYSGYYPYGYSGYYRSGYGGRAWGGRWR